MFFTNTFLALAFPFLLLGLGFSARFVVDVPAFMPHGRSADQDHR